MWYCVLVECNSLTFFEKSEIEISACNDVDGHSVKPEINVHIKLIGHTEKVFNNRKLLWAQKKVCTLYTTSTFRDWKISIRKVPVYFVASIFFCIHGDAGWQKKKKTKIAK